MRTAYRRCGSMRVRQPASSSTAWQETVEPHCPQRCSLANTLNRQQHSCPCRICLPACLLACHSRRKPNQGPKLAFVNCMGMWWGCIPPDTPALLYHSGGGKMVSPSWTQPATQPATDTATATQPLTVGLSRTQPFTQPKPQPATQPAAASQPHSQPHSHSHSQPYSTRALCLFCTDSFCSCNQAATPCHSAWDSRVRCCALQCLLIPGSVINNVAA